MVGFNVVWTPNASFRNTSDSPLSIQFSPNPVAKRFVEALQQSGVPAHSYTQMEGIVWTKLMINLNGAIMALTSFPVKKFMNDGTLRFIAAATIHEADTVIRASGIKPGRVGLITPFLLINAFLLPNWIFSFISRFIIKIDPNAKTSIHVDLDAGRKTEIDYLNGEIVNLGNQIEISTPLNSKIVDLVKEAEKKTITTLTPQELLQRLGLKEEESSFTKYLPIFLLVIGVTLWRYFH